MTMADENNDLGVQLPNGEDNTPAAGLISQYVKDLSFENPSAPAIYQSQTAPEVNVQFDIAASQVGDEMHEVVLKIEVRATMDGTTAFICELSYAGLFGLRNVPEDAIQPFLLGEAPRLLFPFARRVVADAIRDGGFPPLLLDPIDFNGLYYQQLAQQQGQGAIGQA
jgi:preprotein translocase subunit SecB